MVQIRSYQRDVLERTKQAFNEGARVVMPVLPTGGGKTIFMGQAFLEHNGDGFLMAHRSELVSQISLALGLFEIKHQIIASNETRQIITMQHYERYGRSFVSPKADYYVGSVDTVIRREIPRLRNPLIAQDEGHHTLRDNKWGKALKMFPENSLVLLPTATPGRTDGRGLGRHADGFVDRMVVGPTARDLINMGMLTDYDVLAPDPGDLDLSNVHITASGEFNQKELAEALKQSRQLVGNIVSHYCKYALNKLAVCFAANIEEAEKITKAFNEQGIKAELVTGEDNEKDRNAALKRFRKRETMVLVNVDLFGEGFDVPGIEVVIMARPTDSFNLYSQQWGRGLRLDIDEEYQRIWDTLSVANRLAIIAASRKPKALILDHVGNLLRHNGPPDLFDEWSLDRTVRRSKAETSNIVACPFCLKPYERECVCCPHCGEDRFSEPTVSVVSGDSLKKVDGDLRYFTREALEAMRAGVIEPNGRIKVPVNLLGTPAQIRIEREGMRTQSANTLLRHAMAYWAGTFPANVSIEQKQKAFYIRFGVDPITALSLKWGKSEPLILQIYDDIQKYGFDVSQIKPANLGEPNA